MRYSVDDFIGPLTVEQRDALNQVLEPQERILWATRPRAVFWSWEQVVVLVLSLLCLLFSSGCVLLTANNVSLLLEQAAGAGDNLDAWARVVLTGVLTLTGLFFMLLTGFIGLSGMLAFVSGKRYLRNTLYVLTDRKAISVGGGWNCKCYSLDDDMILKRTGGRAGGGLIFRIDEDKTTQGWERLEDREEAERRIQAALADRRP